MSDASRSRFKAFTASGHSLTSLLTVLGLMCLNLSRFMASLTIVDKHWQDGLLKVSPFKSLNPPLPAGLTTAVVLGIIGLL